MTRPRYAAAFAANFVVVAILATPLWWLDYRDGFLSALVSGCVTGVLFGAFCTWIFKDALWLSVQDKLRPLRTSRR